MKGNSTRTEAVATYEEGDDDDDWKAVYTKDDDLKLTNARGNKIRGTMMPPIFSMDAQEASSRVQSKKETALIIDTKHGSLLRSRCLRQSKNHGTDHWSHATRW